MKTQTSFKSETKNQLTEQLLSNDYLKKIKQGELNFNQRKNEVQERLSLAYDQTKETQGKIRSVYDKDLSSHQHTKSVLENCEALLKMTASALKTIQSNPKYQLINA